MSIQFSDQEIQGVMPELGADIGHDLRVKHSGTNLEIEHGNVTIKSGFPSPGADFGGLGILGDIADAAVSVVQAPVEAVKSVIETAASGAEEVIKFAGNAAESAGHAAHSLVKLTDKATGAISELAAKVPFVGPGLHGVIDITLGAPVGFARAVADGERIDKAVYGNLKRQLADIREIAPYAQTVISFVPAVGPGVSGAIGASLALAEGQSLTDALVAGVKDSIPGGPIARGAFTAGVKISQGGRVDSALVSGAVDALPVDATTKAQVTAGLELAQAAATGKPVDKALLKAAIKTLAPELQNKIASKLGDTGAVGMVIDATVKGLPKESKKALFTGIAIGNARSLQRTTSKELANPITVSKLQDEGKKAVDKSDVLRLGLAMSGDPKGYYLGIGIMGHKDVSRRAILELREGLPKGKARLAFDAALAVHIGAATTPPQPKKAPPAFKAGYYLANGIRSAATHQKVAVAKKVAKDPIAYGGMALALKRIKKSQSLWSRILRAIGVETT